MQELIEYLNRKYEALEFWTRLRGVIPIENKIKLIEIEITEAKQKLKKLRSVS